MIPINNSDTAWLIVADYNQENDKFHKELREDVNNPEVNCQIIASDWDWLANVSYVGGGAILGEIGGEFKENKGVGSLESNESITYVGDYYYIGSLVGGNLHDTC